MRRDRAVCMWAEPCSGMFSRSEYCSRKTQNEEEEEKENEDVGGNQTHAVGMKSVWILYI